MSHLHLHSYPKTFNRWANLRAFPIRTPLRINYTFITVCGMGIFTAIELFESVAF